MIERVRLSVGVVASECDIRNESSWNGIGRLWSDEGGYGFNDQTFSFEER